MIARLGIVLAVLLPRPAIAQERVTLEGHGDGINSVAWSPGGAPKLLSGSDDGILRVWESQPVVLHHGDFVTSVASNGTYVASGGRSTGVKLWKGASETALQGPREIFALAFSPDGNRLAAGTAEGTVVVWEVPSALPKLTMRVLPGRGVVHSVAFSPDGAMLAVASVHPEENLTLWTMPSGAKSASLKGHVGAVRSLSFSGDGRKLVSGGDDQIVRVWDVVSRKQSKEIKGHGRVILAVGFHPQGGWVASGGADRSLRIWDVESGKERAKATELPSFVRCLAFSPDGGRLAFGTDQKIVHVWQISAKNRTLAVLPIGGNVLTVQFQDGKKRLLTASQRKAVSVWDISTRQSVASVPDTQGPAAFSPDGSLWVCPGPDNRVVRLMDASNNGLAAVELKDSAVCLAFSQDGKWLAIGTERGVRLHDSATLDEVPFPEHKYRIGGLSFSRDGKMLVTAGEDGMVRLWNLSSRTEAASWKGTDRGAVRCAEFSPDGRILATGGEDGSIRIRDSAGSRELAKLNNDGLSVNALAFSPDGKFLATGGDIGERTIKLWSVADWSVALTLNDHKSPIRTLAFSQDGALLASGGEDRRAVIWDVAP